MKKKMNYARELKYWEQVWNFKVLAPFNWRTSDIVQLECKCWEIANKNYQQLMARPEWSCRYCCKRRKKKWILPWEKEETKIKPRNYKRPEANAKTWDWLRAFSEKLNTTN